MLVLLFISLVAGVLTVLAPCTISLLPVIVGGTLTGGTSYRRAVVVTASLGVSVILFTFVLKVSTLFLNIPQEFWQYISGFLIIFLGLTILFPALWDRVPFVSKLYRSGNIVIGREYDKQNLVGDILIGASLGPVFSSCSPTYFLILAEVLPRNLSEGVIYLFAYTFGLCVSLLIIAVAGQKLLEKVGVASDPRGLFKQAIGVIFLLLGIAILFGYDKKLELAAANHFFDFTVFEQQLLEHNMPSKGLPIGDGASSVSTTTAQTTSVASSTTGKQSEKPISETVRLAVKMSRYPKAPEITNPSGFINTDGKPVTLSQYKGKKVVLVDIWTYSCINCQRTLPYIKAWYDKYKDQGLEIVSIHTPEFAFEKVLSNVQQAVTTEGIKYPVVLDNDYGTWNAFNNQYWPRKYLIDLDGYIVYDHAGEGAYGETEAAIKKALMERASILGAQVSISGESSPKNVITVDPGKVGSPETYFGYARNQYLGNGTQGQAGNQTFSLPVSTSLYTNTLYLSGLWNVEKEYAESGASGNQILYHYKAKDVYFVASSAVSTTGGVKIKITIDGKPIGSFAGEDVDQNGEVLIKENRLYKIIHGSDYGEHTLLIEVENPGLQAYTFTFG